MPQGLAGFQSEESGLIPRGMAGLPVSQSMKPHVPAGGESHETLRFAELFDGERRQLDAAQPGAPQSGRQGLVVIACPGAPEEPWVATTDRDRVGLAMSGGGIRSATFNLGLLQAMDQKGVLANVDYCSTVSGGGYVGGFWTAWRLRQDQVGGKEPALFPRQPESARANPEHAAGPREVREPASIRHLREFSRFLMPRLGFGEVEMWNGVVAVLGGMLPSILATVAAVAAVWLTWFVLAMAFLQGSSWRLAFAAVAFAWLTETVHRTLERAWREVKPADEDELRHSRCGELATWAGVASGVGLAVLHVWQAEWRVDGWGFPPRMAGWFVPAMSWTGVALGLFGLRILQARFRSPTGARGTERQNRQAFAHDLDRTIARCLGAAAVWAALAGLWLVGGVSWDGRELRWYATIPGGSAVGLAALFAWIRRWLQERPPAGEGGKTSWMDRLKPILPQLAANLAVAALLVVVATALQQVTQHPGSFLVAALVAGAVVVATLGLLNPARIGLHEFYRSRIARCFLGAANPRTLLDPKDTNRQTNERSDDDVPWDDLDHHCRRIVEGGPASGSRLALRPIHLVCCAGNNLAGDPLGSLYRGARSVVVSQNGVSVGDLTRPVPGLTLSAALTASAAAFNSNMGFVSMELGPAVAILTTAMNLRLGLWVPHPASRSRRMDEWPGRHFFEEMFARTHCEPPGSGDHPWLHLSDGNHFENFGLYELIRRHCRYVILTDCGADPEYAFDDFARTQRRIREDFGVEIEVDLSPLQPGANGLASQHAVIGTIHYNGVGGSDKGTLIYFKPVLTGDEPPDVLAYRTAHPDFPQQTTADQFYDEAQWESHRRLGEHAGHVIFRFMDRLGLDEALRPERIFRHARHSWLLGTREETQELLELNQRSVELEHVLRSDAPDFLRAEFFPELEGSATATSATAEERQTALCYLMQVAQLMEDAWRACRLDTDWAHPMNEGWMAYMHRWAATPSFRRWWPVLAPIYNHGFRLFVREHFGIELEQKDQARLGSGRVRLREFDAGRDPGSLVFLQWGRLRKAPLALEGRRVLMLEFLPAELNSLPPVDPLVVGMFLGVETGGCLTWHKDDLWVPPALEGAGFTSEFLNQLIERCETESRLKQLRVEVTDRRRVRGSRDPGNRMQRASLVDFYRSRGFIEGWDGPAAAGCGTSNVPGGEVAFLFRDLGRQQDSVRGNPGAGGSPPRHA